MFIFDQGRVPAVASNDRDLDRTLASIKRTLTCRMTLAKDCNPVRLWPA